MKDALINVILQNNEKQVIPELLESQNEPFISAVGTPKNFCVGIIDIVNSTNTVSKLPQNKISLYYELFLNTIAQKATQFNAHILKTMGDSLLFYFPDTCYDDRKFGFLSCLECGFSMMNIHPKLCQLLKNEHLPQIDFRISLDYGRVSIMKNADWKLDLVGPTINTCAKINSRSPINGMIIGGDLYEKTKSFDEYRFKKSDSYSMDLKHPYPLYTICRKN